MKKVLALVLAVLMMATVAFAAGTASFVAPGASIKINLDGTTDSLKDADLTAAGATKVKTTDAGAAITKELTTKNYSLTNIKYNMGKDLIDSIKIDDNDNIVVIKLKQDYTLLQTKGKKIDVSFKLTQKATTGSRLFELVKDETDMPSSVTVGYLGEVPATIAGGAVDIAGAAKTIYKVAGEAYGTANIAMADSNNVMVRVYKDEKYFLASNTDVNTTVIKNNADVDGNFRFVKFPAKPTFNATATIYFYNADEKEDTIYQIDDKGNLSKVGKYSEDDGCWVVKARTLGAYVVSDKALKTSVADATTSNPDTGANDVVGIVTALAAVAMVSAAAVSLKK